MGLASNAADVTGNASDGPVRGQARAPSRSASEDVVQYLERVIFGGTKEPGDSLPSEGELAATLGLSRLTVREGMQALQARGLVEVSHGRRPAVAHPNATPLSSFFSASVRRDPSGLLELLEVRLAIEVHTAQLAATHATRSDLSSLEMALESMRRSAGNEHEFNDSDMHFHTAVASASGNRMLSFLVEAMEDPLQDSRVQSIRGYRRRSPNVDNLINEHVEIFKGISERNPRAAAASMRRHLIQTRNDLRAAFSLPD